MLRMCADSSIVLVLLYFELDELKSRNIQASSSSTARREKASMIAHSRELLQYIDGARSTWITNRQKRVAQ